MRRAGNRRTGTLLTTLPVAAGAVIEAACMVALNAAGYAVEATKKAGETVAGASCGRADNTNGADGDVQIQVERGAYVWDQDGTVTAADTLKSCYVSNSHTVTLEAEGSSRAGTVFQVEDDGVTVLFDSTVAEENGTEKTRG